MKKKLLFASLLTAFALSASAQGYKDGIEYYKAGQYTNALELLNRNLNDPSTDKSMANYYLGQATLAKSFIAAKNDSTGRTHFNPLAAKQYFDAGVAANAENPYNYVGLGEIELFNKNKGAAEDYFKKAKNLAKKNYSVLVDIARAYYMVDPVGYRQTVDKYLAEVDKKSKYQEPSAFILRGDIEFDEEKFADGIASFEQAINFDPNNSEGYVRYADSYFYHNPQFAIQKLEEYLAKNPNSALVQRELAKKYYSKGEYTKAAKLYGEYIQNPNHFPEDESQYALLALSNKDYDTALKYGIANYKTTKELSDKLTLSHVIVAALQAQGKNAEALAYEKEYFNMPEAQEYIRPSDYQIYADLLSANNDSTGLNVIVEGIKKFPNDPSLYYAASKASYAAKNYADAGDYLEKALENTPEFKANNYFTCAQYFQFAADEALEANDPAKATEYANKAVDMLDKIINNGNDNYLYYYYRALSKNMANNNQLTDSSVADLEATVAQMDKNPELANPANPKNELKRYSAIYSNLVNYYKTRDKEKSEAASANHKRIADLLAK